MPASSRRRLRILKPVRVNSNFAFIIIHGLRRRKKSELLVAGMVTDCFVPSSATVAGFATQFADEPSVVDCSSLKPVFIDGHETVTPPAGATERLTESVGRVGR